MLYGVVCGIFGMLCLEVIELFKKKLVCVVLVDILLIEKDELIESGCCCCGLGRIGNFVVIFCEGNFDSCFKGLGFLKRLCCFIIVLML